MLNETNLTLKQVCSFEYAGSRLIDCYLFFAYNSLIPAIFEILLGVLAFLANVTVLCQMYRSSRGICVFDKILMAHVLLDLKICSLNLAFYHIYTIFNYWPFSKELCIFWSSMDTSANTISIFLMLFITWTRIKSVLDPTSYLDHVLIRNPFKCVISIWFGSYLIWIPINYVFISNKYEVGMCEINYEPKCIQFILTLFTWFVPLCLIVFLIGFIMIELGKQEKKLSKYKTPSVTIVTTSLNHSSNNNNINNKKKKNKEKINKFKLKNLKADQKLTIIIVIFLVEWMPSCILWMVDSLGTHLIPDLALSITYWLTFFGSLTDPLLILVLNSKYNNQYQNS